MRIVPCIKHKRLSNFFPHINSRFRSHNIDWCPLHPRHHRSAAHLAGGRILLVATQTISTRICRAYRWEWDEQWKLKIPAAARESAARATAVGTAETTAATAASWPTQQHKSETQRIPQSQDTANRVSSDLPVPVNILILFLFPKNLNLQLKRLRLCV